MCVCVCVCMSVCAIIYNKNVNDKQLFVSNIVLRKRCLYDDSGFIKTYP